MVRNRGYVFMISKYHRKSLWIGIPGLILPVIGVAVAEGGTPDAGLWSGLIGLFGAILIVIGLCYYAKAKGYSAVFGLFGLLSCIGVLILALMPDRTKGKKHIEMADDLSPPAMPVAPPPLPTDASGDSGVFFLAIRGQRQGPYTLGQLRTMWSSGHVPADAQYWQRGMTTWYPLIELVEHKK
jgi:hypothetical protein